MAHLKKDSDGHLLKNSDGHLVDDCGAEDCPTDCSTCDDPITATVSGLGGTCLGCEDCSDLNLSKSLSRSGCSWQNTDWEGDGTSVATLACDDQEWYFTIEDNCSGMMLICARWTAPNTNGCPPETGWTLDTGYDCTGGKLTLS